MRGNANRATTANVALGALIIGISIGFSVLDWPDRAFFGGFMADIATVMFLVSRWRARRDKLTITLTAITATVLLLAVIPASFTTRARLPLGLAMLTAAPAICATVIVTHRAATTPQPQPGETTKPALNAGRRVRTTPKPLKGRPPGAPSRRCLTAPRARNCDRPPTPGLPPRTPRPTGSAPLVFITRVLRAPGQRSASTPHGNAAAFITQKGGALTKRTPPAIMPRGP
jgi:hypothetical protein